MLHGRANHGITWALGSSLRGGRRIDTGVMDGGMPSHLHLPLPSHLCAHEWGEGSVSV